MWWYMPAIPAIQEVEEARKIVSSRSAKTKVARFCLKDNKA
jgi:hypothetical protein